MICDICVEPILEDVGAQIEGHTVCTPCVGIWCFKIPWKEDNRSLPNLLKKRGKRQHPRLVGIGVVIYCECGHSCEHSWEAFQTYLHFGVLVECLACDHCNAVPNIIYDGGLEV